MQRLSFSPQLPSLQLAWDSTSIGELKTCPRKYEYNIIRGIVPSDTAVDLAFGTYYHSTIEHYHRSRATGASHEAALRVALRHALCQTWNVELGRPWSSDSKYKNRWTLIRSIVWYLDKFQDDPLETIILSDGKPAVELSWSFAIDFASSLTGEQFGLCGHMDRLVTFMGTTWVNDYKSTRSTLSEDFFDRYSPDNQVSQYTYAGGIIYAQKISGVIIDAVQVQIEGSKFMRAPINRTEAQLEEWRTDLEKWWLPAAERYAEANYWPQNDKSCNLYGGCPYRRVCSKSPSVREDWLKAAYTQRIWDPLQIRE